METFSSPTLNSNSRNPFLADSLVGRIGRRYTVLVSKIATSNSSGSVRRS